MAEILSQDEIDSLLAALSTGEITADSVKIEDTSRSVKKYDFKRPERFSKDQLHTLQMIHDGFARLFAVSLSSYLRTLVEIKVVSLDQLTYEEFIRSIPSPTNINILSMAPLEGNAIMELNPLLCFILIDRLLGGQGRPGKDVHEFTDIEQHIVQRVIRRSLDNLAESWANVITLTPKLEAWETNPQFAQIVAPTEMAVLITFEVKLLDNSAMMSLCFPYVVLESVISKLSAHLWFSQIKRVAHLEIRKNINDVVEHCYLDVKVEVGSTIVSFSDLLDLKVGDVIMLDRPCDAPIDVLIANRLRFHGMIGTKKNKKAVRITERADILETIYG